MVTEAIAETSSQEKKELPKVEVIVTNTDRKVVLKWGDGAARQVTGFDNDVFTESPFSIKAVDTNGDEPLVKTFGNISACNGGVLTLADNRRFRIKIVRHHEQQEDGDGRKRKYGDVEILTREVLTSCDPSKFNTPLKTKLPVTYERDPIQPFLAPKDWLKDSAKIVLSQADLKESDNPRVSPVALVRCSRGGKTRSMIEIAAEIRRQDPSYGIAFVSFNTSTPLLKTTVRDPMGELCVRLAFAAFKDRSSDPNEESDEFDEFSAQKKVASEWVLEWLGNEKCILFVDELNLLFDSNKAPEVCWFLKKHFLLKSGRGLVFSSHLASISNRLVDFMSSPNNRDVITRPLPTIPSLQQARAQFQMPELSVQESLFLGLIPGLIVEKKNLRSPTTRRVTVVSKFLGTIQSREDVCRLLRSLLTGTGVDGLLQELTTVDVKESDGKTPILRWIPFHLVYMLERVAAECPYVDPQVRHCLSNGIVGLFRQFASSKWESGDAWEALFLIVLIIRCLSGSFDDTVVPLNPLITGQSNVEVQYNGPLSTGVDFFTETDPIVFVGGIPLKSWAAVGTCALSIYYPGHARFEAYDVVLAFWDAKGSRHLFGYQLKEGSTVPEAFALDEVFHKSFLIRGKATKQKRSARLWRSVSDAELDSFFGDSAAQWSAKQWRLIQQTATRANGSGK